MKGQIRAPIRRASLSRSSRCVRTTTELFGLSRIFLAMEESKEQERKLLLKKIEQTRRLLIVTNDERMTDGMTELLHTLEAALRQME
jgi:ribosomal 50S subunit-associated protein YjgA (DUF615 family)